MKMKICTECQDEKPVAQFGLTPRRDDGRDSRCKVCINEAAKVYFRRKIIDRLSADVALWPDQKLFSEIDFLARKRKVVTAELRRRELCQPLQNSPQPRPARGRARMKRRNDR
jgi:hypothetical protein